MRYAILFGLMALLPWHALAADDTAHVGVEILPGRSSVAIRTYGLGLLPLDGQFTRFRGRFVYDPDAPAHCSVALQVDVSSLTMSTDAMGEMVLGPDFLDAARYPALAYEGACNAEGLAGQLTMHGVTRPFALTLDRQAEATTAVGQLLRADWGMTARPLLGGSTVRITVTVPPLASAPGRR